MELYLHFPTHIHGVVLKVYFNLIQTEDMCRDLTLVQNSASYTTPLSGHLLIVLQKHWELCAWWISFLSKNMQGNVWFREGLKRKQMQQCFLQTFSVPKWQLVLLLVVEKQCVLLQAKETNGYFFLQGQPLKLMHLIFPLSHI